VIKLLVTKFSTEGSVVYKMTKLFSIFNFTFNSNIEIFGLVYFFINAASFICIVTFKMRKNTVGLN